MPRIESRIQVIRGLRVMLDVDLAALYGVQTKRLNEQVKRNRDRFPSDFLFQLTADEKTEVVANCDHLQNLKFSKALPFAFTEHGAICWTNTSASRAKRPPSPSSCAPNPAANKWSFCKCTKTASLSPNTEPSCHPKRSWSKSCTQLCLKRVSGWRGAGGLCGGCAGEPEVGFGSGWEWAFWRQARIMTTESRHFICRNTPCAPIYVARFACVIARLPSTVTVPDKAHFTQLVLQEFAVSHPGNAVRCGIRTLMFAAWKERHGGA
ncbi:MAG: ORF6N domain-containing protein [Polaromonas sp.]